MDYARAIKAINKDAEFIINDSDLDNINWLNDTTPISKSNIQTKMTELLDNDETEKTNATNKKASGKQKLKDLGLDDDEIKALMGVE
tara:strand:- start:201 stop:461 length:261 start_codon:yes stop_codon:yes gene_type:complete